MLIGQARREAVARLADAGVGSPDADAGVLLAHVLGVDRAEVARRDMLGHELADDELDRYRSIIADRAARIPLQHLTGRAPFRHLVLSVGPGVFVPRPETEMLVDTVLDLAPQGGTVVDLCTGSGAIALAVKSERPDLVVHAVELDPDAAAWTARNINLLGLDVNLTVGAAQQALPELDGTADVVVSNPPYVPTTMVPVDPEVAEHDPAVALYGGSEDGLRFPLEIAERAATLLRPGGHLVMEHADVQGDSLVAALLDGRGFDRAHDERDNADKPRMSVARREGGARFETPVAPEARPRRSRRTVRLLIVDDDGAVLLYEDSDQGLNPPYTWWSTPGGGVDPGETDREAAVRELYEETGARANVDEFEGPIAERRVVHGYSDQIVDQHDVFFALRRTRFDVEPGGLTPEEQMTMQGWKWWHPADLATPARPVWPSALADLVAAVQDGRRVDLPAVEESSWPVRGGA